MNITIKIHLMSCCWHLSSSSKRNINTINRIVNSGTFYALPWLQSYFYFVFELFCNSSSFGIFSIPSILKIHFYFKFLKKVHSCCYLDACGDRVCNRYSACILYRLWIFKFFYDYRIRIIFHSVCFDNINILRAQLHNI